MTLTIELAPETQEALIEEARRQGTTPEMLAAQELRSRFLKQSVGAQDALRQSLAYLLESADALEPQPPAQNAKYSTEFGEILREKYRRQGLDI